MADDLRARADARLDAALQAQRLADPRDAYRNQLRALRDANPDLYNRATRHYQDTVVPLLADGDDPVEAWVDYGRYLGELLGPGRTVMIDETGRARSYGAPVPWNTLILYVPEDRRLNVVALAMPGQPAPAQRATYDLLVLGRESIT